MQNSASIPDLTQMRMTMDFELILPFDTAIHDLNESVDLILGERGLERHLCEFKLGTSLERFPWPFQVCSLSCCLNPASTCLIFLEWDDIGRPFGVGMILNLDVTHQGLALMFIVMGGMRFYVYHAEFEGN